MINVLKIDSDCFPETKEKMEMELEYDERKPENKKQFDTLQEKYNDFKEYVIANKIQHKYSRYILNNLLSHSFGLKICDLKRILRQEHFIDNYTISLIIKNLLVNRFVEIDNCNQEKEDQFKLYLYPKEIRQPKYPNRVEW